jgi:alkanesulfonate monooxygenase SsuD/methylene tetrahydromethanopterin reductase-like flavin-dependent oxidoreductase (luciferase family)
MMVIVGSTEDEAKRKWQDLEEFRSPEAQTAYFSSLSGLDLGVYDPQTPLEDLVDHIPGIRGAFNALINAWPAGSNPTVHNFLTSLPRMQTLAVTPERIAERIIELQDAGVDGVQIMNALMPETYEEFFEYVVPVLQDKGIMQREYRPGTLRQKLFDTDEPHISARHPAFGYRGAFR